MQGRNDDPTCWFSLESTRCDVSNPLAELLLQSTDFKRLRFEREIGSFCSIRTSGFIFYLITVKII